MGNLLVACDLDGMVFAFPKFFKEFFRAMQAGGNKIGILTARPASDSDALLEILDEMGIKPDFLVGMPNDLREKGLSQGLFKAKVCNDMNVDLLFDDFLTNDPKMQADFFSVNTHTVPFTSWAYRPDKP